MGRQTMVEEHQQASRLGHRELGHHPIGMVRPDDRHRRASRRERVEHGHRSSDAIVELGEREGATVTDECERLGSLRHVRGQQRTQGHGQL